MVNGLHGAQASDLKVKKIIIKKEGMMTEWDGWIIGWMWVDGGVTVWGTGEERIPHD